MAIVKIGFFSLKDGVGCTNFSIHAANYLASGDKSVALVEAKTVLEPKFHTAETIFDDNGTFVINDVHYYPAKSEAVCDEDIEIIDYGKITVLHEFPEDIDKLFLCTDGSEDDIDDISEYIAEFNLKPNLIIIGGSQRQLSIYKETLGLSTTLIQSKSDVYCPYDLSLKIALILRSKNIVPPELNRDWKLDKVKFGSGPIVPKEDGKKSSRSLFGKKKKKTEESPAEESESTPIPNDSEEEENAVLQASEEEEIIRSNKFEEMSYVNVPVPKPKPIEEKHPEEKPEPKKEEKPKPKKEEKPKRKPKNNHNKERKPLFNLNKIKDSTAKITENIAETSGNIVAQIKGKQAEKAKAPKQKVIYTGHITVFVTSFRHGCGASYTAGSIASSMASIYDKDVYIERTQKNVSLPNDYMVKEIKTEDDQFEAYKNGLIVYDKGLYDELNDVDRSDMIHADMNVMVVTNDDMSRVAKFIHEQGDNAYSWLFVFNHVLPTQKKDIEDALADYNVMILPFHDFSAVPPKLIKDWKAAIKTCSTNV